MNLSCCIWALEMAEGALLRKMRERGFDHIDVQPGHLRGQETRELAAELGLTVSCMGASFGMPAEAGLDHAEKSLRRAAINHVSEAIEHAAALGADTVYVVPGKDGSGEALARYADSVAGLAEAAGRHGVKLAVEHFPGTALPSAKATLDFMRDVGQANLYLLYDSGHIQMSGEDAAAVIHEAGERLAYVHLDDNDGERDLHLGLLDGVMSQADLRATVAALKAIGYDGAVSLELSPALDDVEGALRRSREIALGAMV